MIMRRNNSTRALTDYVKRIIEDFSSQIGLTQVPEFITVPPEQIQNFAGSTEFIIVDNIMKFNLKIDKNLISEANIKNHKSQLYITLYHELYHLKNLESLSNSIPITFMVSSINNYADKDSMIYSFAFMLWGEYYAYNYQFMKYDQIPTEYNLLLCIRVFCNDIVKREYMLDEFHRWHNKYIQILQHDIYTLLVSDQ